MKKQFYMGMVLTLIGLLVLAVGSLAVQKRIVASVDVEVEEDKYNSVQGTLSDDEYANKAVLEKTQDDYKRLVEETQYDVIGAVQIQENLQKLNLYMDYINNVNAEMTCKSWNNIGVIR